MTHGTDGNMSKRSRFCCVGVFGFLVGGLVVYLASPLAGQAPAPAVNKGNTTLYGFELPVRRIGEKAVTANTPRISVEVIRDDNNGNLMYISQTGSISVVPGKSVSP